MIAFCRPLLLAKLSLNEKIEKTGTMLINVMDIMKN